MILLAITIAAILLTILIRVKPMNEGSWNSLVTWLCRHRPNLDIIGKSREIYLRRVWLFGHRTSRRALMIHQMNTPDQDRFPHDHPWNFLTLVLWGGYVEETPNGKNYVRPWTFHYRPATYIHRITQLPRGRAYTLVFRWNYIRSWGFWTEFGTWVYWKKFLGMEDTIILRQDQHVLKIGDKVEAVSKRQWRSAETTNGPTKKWIVGGLSPRNHDPLQYHALINGGHVRLTEAEFDSLKIYEV